MLWGCSSTVSRTELIGPYTANVSEGTDSILMREDGSYVHAYSRPGEAVKEQLGTWMLEPQHGGDTRVTFDHFDFGIEPYKSAGTGFWAAVVTKRFGKIRLTINEDMGLYYTKR
jgi:hypothetical protein